MTDATSQPVAVSRRIRAPAHEIFRLLADPARHPELDGSGMLRGAVTTSVISGVGDVFVMKMHHSRLGDYETHNDVVEFEPDRRIAWEPHSADSTPETRWWHRWTYQLAPDGPGATIVTESYDCSRAPEDQRLAMDNGKMWIESMTQTLERLDLLCTGPAGLP
jgi:uncharacterized protein YndB with AHSA1/START domain